MLQRTISLASKSLRGRIGVVPPRAWVSVLVAAGLLLIGVGSFATVPATASPEPSPSLAGVSVTSVGISSAGAGGPGVPPISVNRGSQFRAWFSYDNDDLSPYQVWGNIRVVDPDGAVFPMLIALTPLCTVPAATFVPFPFPGHFEPGTINCHVDFTIPATAKLGAYKVRYTAGNYGATPAFSFNVEKTGWLNVTGPALCVSPSTLDFGDTGTTANLSITNCGSGGPALTWSLVPSAPAWLGVGTASGTNNGNSNITVNRAALPGGSNSATITVNSNAGTQSVAVTAVNNVAPTATPTVPGPTPTATATGVATVTPVATVGPVLGGPGIFFSQTNFWVRDAVPCPGNPAIVANFLTEFNRLGGIGTLGYPASRPYWNEGFCYQVFQRGILQWRVDYAPPQAVLANTMDWLNQAGKDEILFARGVPRHFTGNDGAGGDFELAKQIRFGWMTDQGIRDAYFANPSPGQIPDEVWDPVVFYGLPTSQPQSFGAFTTQRFQRYVFQKWIQAVPGMPPPGSVVGVLAGDLAKEMGLVPGPAMVPETPS